MSHSIVVSVFQRISHRCHHSYPLNPWRVTVPVLNRELSLVCTYDLVELRVAVLGKLLGSLLRILNGFCHHLRFHLLERVETVSDLIVVVTRNDGDALLEQLTLPGDDAAHKVYMVGRHCNDKCDVVTVRFSFRTILVSRLVNDLWRVDSYLLVTYTIGNEKPLDGLLLLSDTVIKFGRSLPNSLETMGHVTLSAFTSCSASPFTVTLRSFSVKLSIPAFRLRPIMIMPTAMIAALRILSFILVLFRVVISDCY